MARKPSGDFDQQKYQNDWNRKNMKRVSADFKAEFVDEFREALTKLDLKMSDVIRQAMIDTIQKAAQK